MKRFYKSVTVAAAKDDAGFAIELDGRPIKTPGKRALRLPNPALAEAVAGEWRAQDEEIDPPSMRLTRLANTSVDRVDGRQDAVIEEIARYGETDLVCYRAESPERLVERQRAAWDPLLRWLELDRGVSLDIVAGVMPVSQSPENLAGLRAAVSEFDSFSLTGLHMVTAASGSVVIGLAVADGHLDGEAAWKASLTDEFFQIDEWGDDPEAAKRRDMLLADISGAARFLELCRQSP